MPVEPHKIQGTKARPRIDAVAAALYATSGNVCAYSDPETRRACEQVIYKPGWTAVQARIAHIVGLNTGSARYEKGPPQQKNTYDNLILLCCNCHNLVDELDVDRHPAEALREMKARHEQRFADVRPRFDASQLDVIVGMVADQMIAQGIVDVAPAAVQAAVSLTGGARMFIDGTATVSPDGGDEEFELITTEEGEVITDGSGEPIWTDKPTRRPRGAREPLRSARDPSPSRPPVSHAARPARAAL